MEQYLYGSCAGVLKHLLRFPLLSRGVSRAASRARA